MTHDDLVKRAVRWLKSTRGCGVAVPELVSYASEQPDAIGWRDAGQTVILVECKVSRSDFLADAKKLHRQHPSVAAGHFRYYLTASRIIKPSELPDGWGLLQVHGKQVRMHVEADRFPEYQVSETAHMHMAYSLLRRVELHGNLKPCLSPKWGGSMPKKLRKATKACLGIDQPTTAEAEQ